MPAAKLCSSGIFNAMKSEEGNDYLDNFIRQAIGKEPLLPFPKTVDCPVQWIQLLHALDQPAKVEMQKCDKCSREFCSPINYRRHIRVHRRSLNVNKEWNKNRDLLAAFWDKIYLEQAREVVAFNDIMIKDISGSSVVGALVSSLRRPGVWTLPQAYMKAGTALLDIIQAKASRLPISSPELFSILDDASERTFLCAGTAESVQKYIFDGETAKNSLELKNIVALSSFLFEQLLVKAWVAYKDKEALRCQKLLVEEEEAAQKRQTMHLERKRRKKLRQKDQKVREQYYGGCSSDLNVFVDAVDRPTSAETSGLSSPSDINSNILDVRTTIDSIEPQNKDSDEDIEAQFDISSEYNKQGDSPAAELQRVGANGHRHVVTNRLQAPKSQRGSRYGLHANLNFQTSKPEPAQKIGPSSDQSLQNGKKVWTKKLRSYNNGENTRALSLQEMTKIEQNNGEVIIGSIPVTLKNYIDQQQGSLPNETQDTFSADHVVLTKKNASAKLVKSNFLQSGTNRVASKLWRPVSRGERKNVPPTLSEAHDRTPSSERSGQSQSLDDNGCHSGKQFGLSHDNAQQGLVPISSEAIKEFLARRWKEAIEGDHVILVLSSGHEPPVESDVQHTSDSPHAGSQVHVSRKPEKSVKFKYIPKQKDAD